jgi:hypothetical protein
VRQQVDATMSDAGAADDTAAYETGTDNDGATPEPGLSDDGAALEADVQEEATAPEVGAADGQRGDDASFEDATDATLAAPVGKFACTNGGGALTCDRATEYCYTYNTSYCVPCSNGNWRCVAVDSDAGLFYFPRQCATSFTCACLAEAGSVGGSCDCIELDDSGAVGISCHACYGSPPARLERLSRAVS